jgi:DNA-binding HxlR family transcriptional regulator
MAAKTYPETTPEVDALVAEVIARVADRWTMEVLEALTQGGTMRFTRLGDAIPGVSQKMLTQTLRQMERDGLVVRTVHPVIPPHVDYALTPLGFELSAAFCGVWLWAEKNFELVARARAKFDLRAKVNHLISQVQ